MILVSHNGSVPARLGKGQGAKEIGHNLAREKPKFGRTTKSKIRSQSSTRTKRGLGTILWAIDENMGTNLQTQTFLHRLSENTTAITLIFVNEKMKK